MKMLRVKRCNCVVCFKHMREDSGVWICDGCGAVVSPYLEEVEI